MHYRLPLRAMLCAFHVSLIASGVLVAKDDPHAHATSSEYQTEHHLDPNSSLSANDSCTYASASSTQTTQKYSTAHLDPKTANELHTRWSGIVERAGIFIERTSYLIDSGHIHVSQTDEVREWLTLVNSCLYDLKQSLPQHIDVDDMYFKSVQAREVCKRLALALQSEFSQLYENINVIIQMDKPSYASALHQADIIKVMEETEAWVEQMEEDLNLYGVTSFNKSYAAFSDTLQRHAGKIGAAAALAGTMGVIYEIQKNEDFVQTVVNRACNSTLQLAADTCGRAIVRIAEKNGSSAWNKIKSVIAHYDKRLRGEKPSSSYRSIFSNQKEITTCLDDPEFACIRHILDPFYKIIDFIVRPEEYTQTNISIPHSILLTGPPGTGKSYAALALAGSIEKALVAAGYQPGGVNFMEITEQQLGQYTLEEIISEARQNAPCVIFIDEIHNFRLQSHEGSIGLIQFLRALDTLNNDHKSRVFMVAATNRPDKLNTDLLRDGRFGTQIRFAVPNKEQRYKALEGLCKKSAIDTEKLNIEKIARLTEGCVLSTLKKLFEYARSSAKQENSVMRHEHLYRALNHIVRHLEDYSPLEDSAEKLVATHQAGKALASIQLGLPLESVTLRPFSPRIQEQIELTNKSLEHAEEQHVKNHGACYFFETETFISQKTQLDKAKVELAGLAAEALIYGYEHDYRADARQKALDMITKYVHHGLSAEKLSTRDQEAYKSQALQQLKRCYTEVYNLLKNNKTRLQNVIEKLRKNHTLSNDEVAQCLQ